MTISAIRVSRPRRLYHCAGCEEAIEGAHVRCYGTCHHGCQPWVIRLCLRCGRQTKDEKIARAAA